MRWHQAVTELAMAGESYVLITVLTRSGSAPRDAGTKMVLHSRGAYDTIGGGQLEYLVLQRAEELLANGQPTQEIAHFPLAAAAFQCCGGSMSVLFEVITPQGPEVWLYGAGYVGQEVATLLHRLEAQVHWIDTRPAFARETAPRCTVISEPTTSAGKLGAASHALVMTHDHQLDYALIEALLTSECASIGLIGSATKWQRFRARLLEAGHSEASLGRIRCPLGAARIASKQPLAIAIAAVDELLVLEAARSEPRRHSDLRWRQVAARLVQTADS